jgi:hypothetical protein
MLIDIYIIFKKILTKTIDKRIIVAIIVNYCSHTKLYESKTIKEKTMSDLEKTIPAQETAAPEAAAPKKKNSFWSGFAKFLYMGGFMLILILGVVIMIVISSVFHCK